MRRDVERLLSGRTSAESVIALTDVYTGLRDFVDAEDAKAKMKEWVGVGNDRFFPHAAQYDFEAWLLPYWNTIQRLAGSNRNPPLNHPELVNHENPPAKLLQEVFRTGSRGNRYVKPRNAHRILRDNDLLVAANACSELKAFLNTILSLCGGDLIP